MRVCIGAAAWCIMASTVGGGGGCVFIIFKTIGGGCRAIFDFNPTGQSVPVSVVRREIVDHR